MLEGKKTYIIVICLILAGVAKNLGYLDEETYKTIFGILAPTGLATLRMGMNKNA